MNPLALLAIGVVGGALVHAGMRALMHWWSLPQRPVTLADSIDPHHNCDAHTLRRVDFLQAGLVSLQARVSALEAQRGDSP